MNHQDHVDLLRGAVAEPRGRWADLGSGEGAFTLALRDLLGSEAEIYSVEKDRASLAEQHRLFRARFPQSNIFFLNADFTKSLDLPALDGLVIANALHFFADKEKILWHFRRYLKHQGRLVLVEYNVDTGNAWVPHPISFDTFRTLAPKLGFAEPKLIGSKPSRFLHEIYSACATKISP